MDEFTHIGFACARFHGNPEDRFAVTGLNCLLGENIEHTRIASGLIILLTIWVLDLAFFRERNWKRPLLAALHPLIWVPFFWASQISTSMTTLFAAIWMFLVSRWLGPGPRPLWSWLFLLTAGACTLVRFEVLAYCGVLAIAWLILNRQSFRSIRGRVAAAAIATPLAYQLVKKLVFPSGFTTVQNSQAISIIKNAYVEAPSYPPSSWPFLQMDSILAYLRALVLPWEGSFYGNWYRWWEIHQDPSKAWIPFVGVGGVTLMSLLLLHRKYRSKSLSDPMRQDSWPLVLLIGTGFFVACAALLSAVPRSDWYYLARAYLGAHVFFIFVSPILVRTSLAFVSVAVILGLSSLSHLAFHYSNPRNFEAYEHEVSKSDHPFLDLKAAEIHLEDQKPDEALRSLFGIYEKIPIEAASKSSRAGVLWSEGLYEAWRIYSILGNESKAMEVYRVLRNSSYFHAPHACLQIPSIPIEECLTEDRKPHLCDSLGFEYRKLKTARPYRKSPEEICGLKPH